MVEEYDRSPGSPETTAVLEVLESGQLWRGNGAGWSSEQDWIGSGAVDRLEDAFGQLLGLPYVHAVNSGTSANEAAVASCAPEPGDQVICPAVCPVFVPFSIIAAGCIPVFADVDPETLLIDPHSVADNLGPRTRAIVVVHLWGTPAPMGEIMHLSEKSGVKVIEDCAQALGSAINGKPVGTFGHAACFSFQQSKHISSGEGGMFVTADADAYARAVLYSNAGIPSFRVTGQVAGPAI